MSSTRARFGAGAAAAAVIGGGWLMGSQVSGAASSQTTTAVASPTTPSSSTSSSMATTSSSTSSAATSSPTASTKSGTYTGTTESDQYGQLTVTITVANGRLTDVSYSSTASDGKSLSIESYSTPELKASVIAANSAKVSMIGGATFTSTKYLASLQSALDQAGI